MTQPPLPKLVFVKRKPSSKRRRRTEIPSPPHSPQKIDESSAPLLTDQHSQPSHLSLPSQVLQRPQSSQQPRRSRGRVMRAQNLSIAPTKVEQPAVDYSAQSLQRLREAQINRPPPSSTTDKQAAQISRVPEAQSLPEIDASKPPTEPVHTAQKTEEPPTSRPAPFTAAWDPIARPDEVAVEDEPDLSFLPVQGGSNSSDDGWEASQLARGGGRVDEQDLSHIIRRTEETPATKDHVVALKSALVQARKEWEARGLTAEEKAQRAAKAAENAKELMEQADDVIREREAVVDAYEDVVQVFRRACEHLRKEKDAIRGYREKLLQRLENEAKEVRVRLLGGEDEFGRSVPGRLVEVDDEDIAIIASTSAMMADIEVQNGAIGFDAEELMDEVIEAMDKWKGTDEEGYTNGFGAQGGGRVIGRLGLALPNTEWLGRKLDTESRKAALESGEVAELIGTEIRARWEPRRMDGFRAWGKVIELVKEDVTGAIKERLGWEVDACVRHADKVEAERCIRGCLEVLRFGVDPGIGACVDRLRDM